MGKIVSLLFEKVETINGKRQFVRLKSSVILWMGALCIPLGIYLVATHEIYFGAFLIMTLSLCLLLYPIIRFFLSGGKDSIAAVVTEIVVEEVTKGIIEHALGRMR